MDDFQWEQDVLAARTLRQKGLLSLHAFVNYLAAIAREETKLLAREAHEANGTPLSWRPWYPGAFRDYVHDQFDPKVQATWERRPARGASPFPRF